MSTARFARRVEHSDGSHVAFPVRKASSSICVDVVHECMVIRCGFATMLSQLADVSVAREFESAAVYVDLPAACHAPVALVSPKSYVDMVKGGTRLSLMRCKSPVAIIIVAPAFGDLDAHEALERGVKGLLLHSVVPIELGAAIRRVSQGSRYVMHSIVMSVNEHIDGSSVTAEERQTLSQLSDRDGPYDEAE